MPRKLKERKVHLKWDPSVLQTAMESVISGDVSLRGASELFKIPLSTLHDRVRKEKDRQLGLNTPPIAKIGHPTVLSLEIENSLVDRLLALERKGLGLTALQVRRAAYDIAESTGIVHPWNPDNKVAGIDWFRAFLKRHRNISLRKPEGLSRARAAGLNEKEVKNYFSNLRTVMSDFELFDKPQYLYNVDESGIPLNNRPLKIVSEKGKREVVCLTNVERGENVTVVACFSASGSYIPPMIIFKGARKKQEFTDGLPACSVVEMSDSGYINEELFLKWLEHFNKFKIPGRVLLIMDNHGSHTSLQALEFCQRNQIELLGLPPHSTHVLQPLDRTFFKSLKANYHRKATEWMQRNPTQTLSKVRFNPIFCEAFNTAATVACAVKGFACTGIMPFSEDIVPLEKLSPAVLFETASPEDIHCNFGPSRSNEEKHDNPKIIEPPNFGAIGSETPSTVPNSTNCKTSPEIVHQILPTPEKQKKLLRKRKCLSSVHLTSPQHIADLRAKKKLFKDSSNKKTSECKGKKERKVSLSSPSKEDECGFCFRNYYSVESVLKGDWIRCQNCNLWYHEECVGAKGKKQFICGKCK